MVTIIHIIIMTAHGRIDRKKYRFRPNTAAGRSIFFFDEFDRRETLTMIYFADDSTVLTTVTTLSPNGSVRFLCESELDLYCGANLSNLIKCGSYRLT